MIAANDNKALYRAERRDVVAAKKTDERKAMHVQRARLAKRSAIGKDWDGSAANDNRIDWPLSKAMLADGNNELLKVAIKVRCLYEKANSEPLIGENGVPSGELSILHRYVDKGNGSYVSKGEIVLKAATPVEYPAQRATPTSSDSKQKATPIPKPWTGDRYVNDAIDARDLVSRLRFRLGPLAEPMELAVVDNKTLQEVGNALGIANRAGAMGAGKVTVYNALVMVRDMPSMRAV